MLKFKNHEYDSKKIVQSYKNKFLLSKTGIDLVGMVFQDYQKKINSFAVRTMWFLVKSKGYCLYQLIIWLTTKDLILWVQTIVKKTTEKLKKNNCRKRNFKNTGWNQL